MIRIAAAYPREPGKKFDLDYYMNSHLPLVQQKFAPFGLTTIEVDQGLESPGGGESPFFAIGYLYFKDLDGFRQAYASVGASVIADISIYTDVKPMIQVGQLKEVKA